MTGLTQFIGDELPPQIFERYASITAASNGRLYAVPYSASRVLEIDPETGTAPWCQTCVAVVRETPQLVELQRRLFCAFQGSGAGAQAPLWAPPLRKPHLSLAYGSAPSVLAEVQVPAPFVADSLAIWDCCPATLEGVSGWHEISRVPL